MKQVVVTCAVVLAATLAAALPGRSPAQDAEADDEVRGALADILRAVADELSGKEEPAVDADRNPEIPDDIYTLVEGFDGVTGLALIRKPESDSPFSPMYVARVEFEPLRPGHKACPDHYPVHLVKDGDSCPNLANGDAPGAGWLKCHDRFYTHEKFGCPPLPTTPQAPASTPKPRCQFGPEACSEEAPGGPVLIRTLKAQHLDAVVTPAAPAAAIDAAVPRAAIEVAAPAAAVGPAARAGALTPAVKATPQTLEAATAVRAQTAEGTRLAQLAGTLNLNRLQLREPVKLETNLSCTGDDCEWGGNNEPILLPPPPVIPVRHAPCEYEHVSFFVPEDRYCPKAQLGQRPAPGAELYVSWGAGDATTPKLNYHRDDFDGISKYLAMIIGSSDDRFAMNEATDREKAAARATAMLISNENVVKLDDGLLELGDDGEWPNLCSSERFAGLPQPGHCSGVKIGERLVATSAHCVRNSRQCNETSVVFGYAGDSATSAPRTVEAEQVFYCTSIVATRRPASFGERGADWTIFEVDRDIDAPSVALAPSEEIDTSLVTTVIGHPLGLPTIVTRLGVVQAKTTQYFITNSDTFVGNSGSAVFLAQSVEDEAPRVLGLLTGGQYDFEHSSEEGEECLKAKWCRDADCLGDDVVYADDLIAALSQYSQSP